MINWVITQAAMGEFEGKQVIPKGAVSATRQPQSILNVDHRNNQNTHFYVYALGAMVNDKAGKVVVKEKCFPIQAVDKSIAQTRAFEKKLKLNTG